MESHPISEDAPDWLSYPHWHNEMVEDLINVHHIPLVEPIVEAISIGINATKSGGCKWEWNLDLT